MNAEPMSLFDEPRARVTDPVTSHLAAVSVRPGAREHEQAIVKVLERYGPLTHEDIVRYVEAAFPRRWKWTTTVSACARVPLFEYGTETNERGHPVKVWSLTDEAETVQTSGVL